MIYCHKCGKELNEGDTFCSKCGTEITSKKEHIKEEHHHKDHEKDHKEKKPWYTRWWAILLFFIIFIGIVGSLAEKPNQSISKTTPQKDSQMQTSVTNSGQYLPVGTKGVLNNKQGELIVVFTDESSLNKVIDYIYANNSENLKNLVKNLTLTGKTFVVNTGTKAEIIDVKTENKGDVIYQVKILEGELSGKFVWVISIFFVETSSQNAQCQTGKCSGSDFYDCTTLNGLKQYVNMGKYKGKCGVECVIDDDCSSDNCENYICKGAESGFVNGLKKLQSELESYDEKTKKLDRCTNLCCADNCGIPAFKNECYLTCNQVYYEAGIVGLDALITNLGG